MKNEIIKPLKKIIVFGLLFLLVFSILNFGYYHFILTENILERTYADFLQYKKDITILFMGDSHSKSDINPNYINSSYNFADTGENYIQTYYKLESVLYQYNVDVEVVVLPIDLHTFSSSRLKRISDEWYWNRYLRYDELMQVDKNITFFDVIGWKFNSIFPIIGKGQEIIEYFMFKEGKSQIVKGHIISEENFSQQEDKYLWTLLKVQSHLEYSKIIDETLLLYFTKCLELCSQEKLEIILIKYPISDYYFNATVNFIPNKDEFYKTIENTIENFTNIHVLDYQSLYFGKNELFRDCDHLNENGSYMFSQQVKNDLMNIVSAHSMS